MFYVPREVAWHNGICLFQCVTATIAEENLSH